MPRFLLALLLAVSSAAALADYDATSPRATDLSGRWRLNATLSEDPEALLAQRMEKERKRWEQRRRIEESSRPPGMPPPIDVDAGARTSPKPRPWQLRRDENYRKMLAVSSTLVLEQDGRRLQIVSEVESRSVEAGTRSQVSMPEGELADSQVGWDGEWFVIERRVRRGPRVIEKFRRLSKSDQLEYLMSWSGDSELAGIKVRRIYDRDKTTPRAPEPAVGPGAR